MKSEAKGDYAAYGEAIEAAYLVGSPVVRELAGDAQPRDFQMPVGIERAEAAKPAAPQHAEHPPAR